jgi:hypothetical protein
VKKKKKERKVDVRIQTHFVQCVSRVERLRHTTKNRLAPLRFEGKCTSDEGLSISARFYSRTEQRVLPKEAKNLLGVTACYHQQTVI